MKIWEVKLKGNTKLLEKLSKEYCSEEMNIELSNGDYYLQSSYLNELSDNQSVYEKSIKLIGYLNTSLKLSSLRINTISSDGFWLSEDNGKRVYKFNSIYNVEANIMSVVYGKTSPPAKWYKLWDQFENVRYVFRLYNSEIQLDWFSLYKIYETIRDDPRSASDGKENIELWTSVEANSTFFKTANWYRHSDYGRNKKTQNTRPINEISISQANSFIRDLIINWLNFKAENI